MPSFKKKNYTEPIICKHKSDFNKDWYVFFRYKNEGKVYKYKRREGVNRIKDLNERLKAIEELCQELSFDLKNGWNPLTDPKRELDYNPFNYNSGGRVQYEKKKVIKSKTSSKEEIFAKYLKGKGH